MKKMIIQALCAFVVMTTFTLADPKKADKAGFDIAEPAFKTKKNELDPVAEIKDDSTVVLANRGLILSKGEFKEGCVVRLKWTWTSEDTMTYPDHLMVVFRTNGKQKEKWTFGIDEGLQVRLNPHGKGFVEVEKWEKDKEGVSLLGRSKDDVSFSTDKTHDITISDAGDVIVVEVDGKEVLRQKVDPKDGSGTWKIAIYNREPVAGFRKVSTLTDLKVTDLK